MTENSLTRALSVGGILLLVCCSDKFTMGLAWDVTDGEEIDLDASCIFFDKDFSVVDQVWYRQLESKEKPVPAMVHLGDEREGDEQGDDEQIQAISVLFLLSCCILLRSAYLKLKTIFFGYISKAASCFVFFVLTV